jgi:hypothetical protein
MSTEKPFRDGTLTSVLLLIQISTVGLMAMIYYSATKLPHPKIMEMAQWFLMGMGALNIIFSFGVWFWKRWGIYGLGTLGLFSLVMGFPIPLFEFGLLAYLIRNHWRYMD